MFITAFKRALHLSLSWARSIQSMPHPTSWRSILSSRIRLGFPSSLYSSCLPTKTSIHFFCLPYVLHVRLSHASLLCHPNNIWFGVQFIKLLVIHSQQRVRKGCRILLFYGCTRTNNNVRELIAVKVLHTSLLNTTVVAFKVRPFGSYAPMPVHSPPFKTILELVLWNGLQSCRCITPDVINVIKMPSFQYFLCLREQKKVIGG